MQLLAQEEYGLRCLVQVARHSQEGPASASAIAEAEGLSPEYAARLLGVLRRAELVRSRRGPSGGYELTRPAAQITVSEAMEALGGPLFSARFCMGPRGSRRECVHVADCALRGLWQSAEHAVRGVLGGVSIADLARGGGAAKLGRDGPAPIRRRGR